MATGTADPVGLVEKADTAAQLNFTGVVGI